LRVALQTCVPASVLIRVSGPAGSREVLAIVDTGATPVLPGTRLARQIGYEPSAAPSRDSTTVGGPVSMPSISIHEVALGSVSVRDLDGVCYDIPGSPVAALLGLSFLQHFRVTLSPKEGFLELVDP